ncbi:MAG TPA: PilC/PilY family type IV pilus protein [Woeseiaceae bacterium]
MNHDLTKLSRQAAPGARLVHLLSAAAMTVITALPALIAAPAWAEIAQSPLFLNVAVNPNLILAIDDSGSMDSEVLMPTNDGALWWHVWDQSFVGRNQTDDREAGVINFNGDGAVSDTWKKYVYLFPNGTGISSGRRAYPDDKHDHFAVPPIPRFAFARSPEYNAAYFNPTETYVPWPDVGGYTFSDSDPRAAKTDPVFGSETFDLTAEIEDAAENHVFRMFSGMTLPAGLRVCAKPSFASNSCGWKTLLTDEPLSGDFWVGIRYFPATFYVSAEAELPAEYSSYVGVTAATGYSPGAALPDLVKYEIRPENFSNAADYDAAIGNFANWFTYYRKRHLATRGGIAASFEKTSSLNAASFRINNRVDVSMHDLSAAAEREAFFKEVLTSIGNGGTPNREALDHAGEQYQRTDADAPITLSCQQNFTALFTDGYSNPTTGIAGNEDAGFGAPFEDTASGTMADIAMYYYKTNLRPDLDDGEVNVPQACAGADPDPSLDCNEDPHMGSFGVLLGNNGQIYGVDTAATSDPYTNPPAWPTSFPVRHPSAVDDLWHATINSRGAMLSARRPSEISEKFSQVLSNIADRVASSAAVAANSTRLDSDTAVFQASFDSTNWSGELRAFRINSDGTIDFTPAWNAADELDALTNTEIGLRKIFTAAPPVAVGDGSSVSKTGADFEWTDLTTAQQDYLRDDPNSTTLLSATVGQERLAWIRGSRLQEGPSGSYRRRDSRLGDIVNSDPQFAHQQDFGYFLLDQSEAFEGTGVGAAYRTYRQSTVYQTKPPMVVVGANDGMLHGFDASLGSGGGQELFAFVPNAVIQNLYELAEPAYSHRFYVDSSPRVADALVDGSWKTIVVGATGAGGKSVFALDITDPTNITSNDVLWEFEHTDMGYTIGQPAVAPLPNGKFGVIVTSGYDTGVADGKIWILDTADGSIIKTIVATNSGDLGAPLVTDLNGDRVADRIYVGDTKGNLWRFDLKTSNTNQWGLPQSLKGPLFVATDANGTRQAITAPLSSAFNEDGLHTIFFGTGSYYRVGDNMVPADPDVDTFYGIIDQGTAVSRGDLLGQSIITQVAVNGTMTRAVTANDMQSGHDGWYLDLAWSSTYGGPGPQGERVVSRATVRGDRVIFATLIPNPDACAFGGESWLMELNTFTGGRLEYAVFDLDDDGLFDDSDWITVTENGETVRVPPSGIAPDINIVKTPAIIAGVGANQDEVKIMSGSSGELIRISERGDVGLGRQSWRQLR